MVMCRYEYEFSEDVGERLCQDWISLLKLLGPVLELAKYQQGKGVGVCLLMRSCNPAVIEGSVAVEGWAMTEFDYHKLKISHRSSEKVSGDLWAC